MKAAAHQLGGRRVLDGFTRIPLCGNDGGAHAPALRRESRGQKDPGLGNRKWQTFAPERAHPACSTAPGFQAGAISRQDWPELRAESPSPFGGNDHLFAMNHSTSSFSPPAGSPALAVLPAENQTAAPLAPSEPPPAPGGRSNAIGYLRAFVTVLVVAHHAGLAYHPYAPKPPASLLTQPRMWQAFPIVDSQRWPGIDLFIGFNDTFFMSLMFLISGLFVMSSLRRKGAGEFARDRAFRLGLPFAIAAVFLGPLSYYPTYRVTGADPGLAAFAEQWLSLGTLPAGPAWFLWVLLAFGLVAALVHRLAPPWGDFLARRVAPVAARPFAFFTALVGLSALAYLPMANLYPSEWAAFGPFTIQTARVFHYALYFAVGIALGSYGIERSFLAPGGALARRWGRWSTAAVLGFIFVVVTFVTYVGLAMRGEQSMPLLTLVNFAFVVSCAASTLAFCALFVRFAQRRNAILESLSANAFGIYFLHYVFVNWLQFALLGANLSGAAKGSIVIVGGLALSWLTSALLRRVPFIGRIL